MSSSSRICSFALSLPLYHLFDYALADDMPAQPGMRYEVPFGSARKTALLIDAVAGPPARPDRIKPVLQPLDDEPILSPHLIQLAKWLADYYCQPLGEVIFQFLPVLARKPKALPRTTLTVWAALAMKEDEWQSLQQKAPRQFEIMQALQQYPGGLDALQLSAIHSGWRSAMKALLNKGWVQKQTVESLPTSAHSQQPGHALTPDQQRICDDISPQLMHFQVHLIQGVTGSGKTEVYLPLMQQVLQAGRQVIYLVPEIGLTPQLLQRLQQALGNTVVASHSSQSDLQRYKSWDQFRRGAAQVLIGTRSALFASTDRLGLIIIDEEHDASFRQQDGVRYHARDVAIKRAQMLDIPVLLGSATPSIESLHNAQLGRYRLHRLDQRVNQTLPPKIELLDCSHAPLNAGCSTPLLQAIERHLQAQGQVLLFLNRRGFAPVVMCHECGWQSSCYQCDARMTLHQSINRLICHHCGFSVPLPQKCPSCGERKIRHYGVGTEQLEQFLQTRFGDTPIVRIDRDSVKSARQFEQRMETVRAGQPCILVGTQMLAKGHDYPHITLVGLLDTDQALYSSFYRASERLVQTVLQVSGRAGRAQKAGQALLQTAFPEHPLMQNLCRQDYGELMQEIMQERKMVGFPPYVRVVCFIVDAVALDLAMDRLRQLKSGMDALPAAQAVKLVGPIPALMTRRIGRYRAQLTVLADDFQAVRRLLRGVMPLIEKSRNTPKSRLSIEVDPLDF